MANTISVSLEGDKADVKALGIMADQDGVTIGKLVRAAIVEKYGVRLEPLRTLFVASTGERFLQSERAGEREAGTRK